MSSGESQHRLLVLTASGADRNCVDLVVGRIVDRLGCRALVIDVMQVADLHDRDWDPVVVCLGALVPISAAAMIAALAQTRLIFLVDTTTAKGAWLPPFDVRQHEVVLRVFGLGSGEVTDLVDQLKEFWQKWPVPTM